MSTLTETQKWFKKLLQDFKGKPHATIGGSEFWDRIQQLLDSSIKQDPSREEVLIEGLKVIRKRVADDDPENYYTESGTLDIIDELLKG